MKLNIVLVVLLIIAAAAAAIVYFGGSPSESPEPPVAVATEGTLDLLVFGVEGLEPTIAEALMDEGRMPNLSALMESGAYGEFDNFGKIKDPKIVWTSLVTGMKPENQGLGSKRVHRERIVDVALLSTNRTVDTIWTLLAADGSSVAVLGWPGTWPAEEIDGGVVAGPYTQYVLERAHNHRHADGISPDSAVEQLDPLYITEDAIKRADLSEFVNLDSRLGLEGLVGQNYVSLANAMANDTSMRSLVLSVINDPGVRNVLVYDNALNNVTQRYWHYMKPECLDDAAMGDEARAVLKSQAEALGETLERYYEHTDELLGSYMKMVADGGTVVLVVDHGYEGVKIDRSGVPRVGFDMHSRRGFFVMAGPRVRQGVRADEGDLIDVAPTIMEAAGIKLPSSLDGRVHEEILR